MAPAEPMGPLSEEEVREVLVRVLAFVAWHPRKNQSIVRRLDDAISVLAPDLGPDMAAANTTATVANTNTSTGLEEIDMAVEMLDQAAEACITRADGVIARWRLRAARNLGRDAIRALGAGVLVSQEERTSAASHAAHAQHPHGPDSPPEPEGHSAPPYAQASGRCKRGGEGG